MEQNAGFPKESRIGGFTIKDLSRPVIPWTGCDSTTKGQAIGQATSWGHAEPPALLPISGGTLRAERPQPEGAAAAEGWEGHLGICSQILFWWGGVGKNGINPKEVLPFSFLPPAHLEGRVCVCVCCRYQLLAPWIFHICESTNPTNVHCRRSLVPDLQRREASKVQARLWLEFSAGCAGFC